MSTATFNGMDIARSALRELKKAGADKAVVSLSRGEQNELNVDAGELSLYRSTVNLSLSLTALCNNRKGSASLNRYDPRSIAAAAQQAVAMAQASEPDPANDISPQRQLEIFDSGPTEPEADLMYERLTEFVDHAKTRYPSIKLEQCILDFSRGQSFFANSNGAEFQENSGIYGFSAMFTAKEGSDASSFNYSGAAHKRLDKALKDWGSVNELMAQACEQLRLRPVEGSFTGDIVLTPDSLGDFLGMMDGVYLGSYAMVSGSSPWKDKLGSTVISPLITIRSEPVGSAIDAGYSYTGDGFRAENCVIIDKGMLKYFTLGLYASNKTGKSRCPSGGGAISMDGGTQSRADIIKGVKKGILLGRFSGGNPSDNGDFSGVAKNSYLIENGQIVRPVSETMLAGNLATLFESVSAVSKERVDFGSSILPWIRTGGIHISGS